MSLMPMTPLPSQEQEILEEALSEIYECFEKKLKTKSEIEPLLNAKVRQGVLDDLVKHLLANTQNGSLQLTKEGETIATRVIRRKRLAERLLKDVLNLNEEHIDPAACQWEHVLSPEVTNSICTLLGHPSHSPRDLPIPPGDCCRSATTRISPVICSLDKLGRGKKAKISYLLLQQSPALLRLLSMGLIPGSEIEVLERFPTYVVQLGESQLAFETSLGEAIFVHPL